MFSQIDRVGQSVNISSANAGRNSAGRILVDNRKSSSSLQCKRRRQNESEYNEELIQSKKYSLQRAVDDQVPNGTRIIIDNPGARDFGDTGTLIRRSCTEEDCMVVEFDNETGVYYRVYNYEMSPLVADDTDAYKGLPAGFSMTARNGQNDILIVGTFDLTDPDSWTADFSAIHKGVEVGDLKVISYTGTGFYLTDINTASVPEEQRVSGLGSVLLHVAAIMASQFGYGEIELGATKKKETHPGPFYKKFGFQTDFSLDAWAGNLAAFLTAHGDKTIKMTGNTQDVAAQTGAYIAGKEWELGEWRAHRK